MLLVYTQKATPRITYIFKHICTRILGIDVGFTSVIEEFISHNGPKLSYGKQPLGNEIFLQCQGLLTQQGFESVDFNVKNWEETKCFFSVGEKSALPFDIFSASFYLLSRYEEYLPHLKDEKGRFPAMESLGYKENFLEQPVIDIWAYKFKEVLQTSFIEIEFPKKSMIIHNLIEAHEPFAYKHKGFFRSFVGFTGNIIKFRFRSFFKRSQVLLGFRNDPYDTFEWIINKVKKSKTNLIIFFLLGESNDFMKGINSQRKKFKILIKFISDYKNVGLIFSSESLIDSSLLKREKLQLENITNRSLLSTMNKEYMVNLPDIYRYLIELEIERDFTMVYEDEIGFRAGTCTPFLFYDLDYEIKTPLTIHPIALTTSALEDKKDFAIQHSVSTIMSSVKKVNGTFSIIFNNKNFIPVKMNNIWRSLFSEKLQQYE